MSLNIRKILAVVIVIIVAFGWFLTVKGVGSISPINERMDLGLDIKGGVYVVLEADQNATKNMDKEELRKVMEQTQAVIEKRVNEMGLSEPTVTIEGDDRIRIELPGVENSEEAIEQVGKTAQLKFILADGSTILTGSNIKNAESEMDKDSTGYAVVVQFDSDGTKAFGEGTTKAYNREVKSTIDGVDDDAMAIILDGEIISAPTVGEPITGGSCEITGNFSQEEARNLAALIRGGALPIELNEITSSVQSAKIGHDALEHSVYAGLIGLALVLLLMIVVYKGLGIAADIALLLYVAIILNLMSAAGVVLTLPGIAGIIVAVGMAVDANVIIFSRIREEIKAKKNIQQSTEVGFRNAMPAILDSQVTTLIAAVILYEIGTSSVKGFAFTFMLGIVVSMFTALVVTQLYVKLFSQTRFATERFFGINYDRKEKTYDFINRRKLFYAISACILVLGLVFGVVRGPQYGIDFTGGTMMQLDMHKQVKISDVEKALSGENLKNLEIIYGGTENEEIILRTTTDLTNKKRVSIVNTIKNAVGDENTEVITQEEFGASVGKELRNNAILAILISALCMLVYIRFRFKQWKFGLAAILGDLHDVLVVVSFYLVFGVMINNPFIAGILTVVGYSINDTIVVFDRIRENQKFDKPKKIVETINRSVSQTLGRSLMTSLTTIIVMIPLAVMGGEAIRTFVLPLMVGILAGTYSSICFCSPLFYDIHRKISDKKNLPKNETVKEITETVETKPIRTEKISSKPKKKTNDNRSKKYTKNGKKKSLHKKGDKK